jgi:hypothetical protein
MVPSLPSLLEWAEAFIPTIPKADFDGTLFSIMVIDGRLGVAGFSIMFNEQFSSASSDSLTLKVQRQGLMSDDPLTGHEHAMYLRDYPSIEEFFAAVRADPHYQFACTYPFNEPSIYADPRAGTTKAKG